MYNKVLILDKTHPILKEVLTQNGYNCIDLSCGTDQSIMDFYSDVVGIVLRSKIELNKETINRFSQLKFIGRVGSGLENIDLDFCKKKEIAVFSSPEGNSQSVAEHALGMLLSLLNNFKKIQNQLQSDIWERESNSGTELYGKTIGVIGYGNNGKAFSKLMSAFHTRILVYDKYKSIEKAGNIEESTMEKILEESDIISLHLPLTRETQNLINEAFINLVKKPFILINISRGQIVNTGDLVKAIRSKKIVGACLDVLEYESKRFNLEIEKNNEYLSYLIKSNNVVITPHVAGLTKESFKKLSEVLAKKIVENINL